MGTSVNTCKAIYCERLVNSESFMCNTHWTMVPYDQQQLLSNNTLTPKEHTKLFAIIKLEIWDRNKKVKTF